MDLGKSYIQFVRNNMDTITKRINDDLWVLNVMEKWYYDQVYNRGKQNWPFFKTADFSINNAINPTNLGAK